MTGVKYECVWVLSLRRQCVKTKKKSDNKAKEILQNMIIKI